MQLQQKPQSPFKTPLPTSQTFVGRNRMINVLERVCGFSLSKAKQDRLKFVPVRYIRRGYDAYMAKPTPDNAAFALQLILTSN